MSEPSLIQSPGLVLLRQVSLIHTSQNASALRRNAASVGWTDKLAEMVQIRGLARQRETTVGELVMGAARGAPPPPHPDQWMPRAERERHEDEVSARWTCPRRHVPAMSRP